MKIVDFELYKDLLYTKSGLQLTPDKSYLLDSRLTPIAKKWGFPSLDVMSGSLRGLPDPGLVKDIVEAMTTNETSFFRDTRPFDNFEKYVLPHMIEHRAKAKRLRIWCAACSSGQEPYSLAMILKEKATQISNWHIEILATDLSDDILEHARQGLYSQFEVQRGLPVTYLMKYFSQDNEKWRISNEIKHMVRFENFNLLERMSALGNFDVIFCRNVLIYFDNETKTRVLMNMSQQIASDGFLFLGGAETVLGISDRFKLQEGAKGLYVPIS